ncbi:MAG: hypothetical protein ABIW16_01640 [Sphingomicrobium sp.]
MSRPAAEPDFEALMKPFFLLAEFVPYGSAEIEDHATELRSADAFLQQVEISLSI